MDSNEIERAFQEQTEESRNILRKWASKALITNGNFVKYAITLESVIYWQDYGKRAIN